LGGKGGGHAKLTEFGRMLVAHYRAIEKESGAVFSERIASLEARLSTMAPQD
jgi:molybdate transport repressor ModE-like protein